ncbi:hypothetical protein CLM62_12665 [Streptomyces sp. SA15]|uniref:hypothetical protein n=1 Tax=Streptomyces sp. SA15 TaxID=934019 RepID=UPI000BB067A3|nr:hypothetical protein [Streptomyces sp. SA15]PAZ15642.1 hypothetical protein CLM62_12665 [Streptomyces sp. SA15]
MQQSTCPAPPRPVPTVDHLMDAPLNSLLAEFRVDVSELPIEDPGFTGGTYVRRDGTMLFAMRRGQPAAEREMIARAMLGAALRVPMPPLPEPYQLTEL